MQKPEKVILKDMNVLYTRKQGPYVDSTKESWPVILDETADIPNIETSRRFGIPWDNPNYCKQEAFRYDACLTIPKGCEDTKGLKTQTIRGGKYLLFKHPGHYDTIMDSIKILDEQWYAPDSEIYSKICMNSPIFLEYLNIDEILTNPDKVVTKIYVPLK